MILVEVGEPLGRRIFFQPRSNEENMQVELDMREEHQEVVRIKKEAVKCRAIQRHNTKV